jgi:hypothetical protein
MNSCCKENFALVQVEKFADEPVRVRALSHRVAERSTVRFGT